MTADLLKLPWQILVALVSGYAGYLVAYVGLRSSHTPVDATFRSLGFALLPSYILWALDWAPPVMVIPDALLATLLVAMIWRRWLMGLIEKYYRHSNLSWMNDDASALTTLTKSTEYCVTQVAVLLDDGTWLSCENASKFADAPFGPVCLGPSGDVALYVSHIESPKGIRKETPKTRDPRWGDRVTYVPAARIKRITLRHDKRS